MAKQSLTRTLEREDGQKKEQDLFKIADQVRNMMVLKQKTALQLKDVITALNDSQRGSFKSRGKTSIFKIYYFR